MTSEVVAGFIGAMIGALIGLAGVFWQFRAKSKLDKRQLGAELLLHSQQLRDGYREEFGPEKGQGISHTLENLKQHQDQLVLLMRTWELVWDRRSFAAASRHVRSAITYYQCASSKITMGSDLGSGELSRFEDEWFYSRKRLIDELSASFGIRWWQVQRRFKAWRKVGDPVRLRMMNYEDLTR